MLSVKNLTKTYIVNKGVEVRALDGVTMELPETGMIFLLGRSGSGKSTLLNICGGLDYPTDGEVIIDGISSKNFTKADYDSYRNTYVGFVFQEYNILEEFTVEQNVSLALELQNKPNNKDEVANILKTVGLDKTSKRKPNTLSGGQRQRVAIARALVKNPRIIMADEPTGALDNETGEQIFELLKSLSKDRLVLVVSHDRDFANKYGDRIIEFADGKIISDRENTIKTNIHEDDKTKSFIKSKLPLRYAYKIAANSIKRKPIRLAFTILLAVIAFVFFGVSSTLVLYNPNYSIAKALENSNYQSIVLGKQYSAHFTSLKLANDGVGVEKQENYLDFNAAFTEKELQKLNENGLGLKFAGVMNLGSYRTVNENNVGYTYPEFKLDRYRLDDYSLNHYFPFLGLIGFSDCGETYLTDNGFSLACGKYPESPSEIAIPYYIFEMYKYGYRTRGDFGGDFGGKYEFNEPKDIIGETIWIGDLTFTVVGVVNVGEIPERYKELRNKDTKLDRYGLTELQEEFKDVVKNSFHTVGFVSSDFYNQYKYHTVSLSSRRCWGLAFSSMELTSDIKESSESHVMTPKALGNYKEVIKTFDLSGNEIEFTLKDDEAYLPIRYIFERAERLYPTIKAYEEYSDFKSAFDNLKENYGKLEDGSFSYEEFTLIFNTVLELYEKKVGDTLNIPERIYFKNLTGDEGSLKVKGYYMFFRGTNSNVSHEFLVPDSVCDKYKGPEYKNGATNVSSDIVYETNYVNEGLNEKYGKVITLTDNTLDKSYFMLGSSGESSIYPMMNNVYLVSKNMAQFIYETKLVFCVAGAIFGLFASLMMYNFISVSISAKKKEIGILRAVGARRADVLLIFIIETILITTVCFVSSIVLTVLSCILMNNFMLNNAVKLTILDFNLFNASIMFIICYAVSLLATIFPILKISNKSPVDEIRTL